MRLTIARLAAVAILCSSCAAPPPKPEAPPTAATPPPAPEAPARSPVVVPGETRLSNIRMLTDGGENAEAYWSWDGTRLVFQARRGDEGCDRMKVLDLASGTEHELASRGAHTCGFFLPGDGRIVFSSTMSGGDQCPPPPDRSKGYTWALHATHEIYSSLADGSDVKRLTDNNVYDAESTVSKDGRIVFTSSRDGDLDIYTMAADGTDVKRLTTSPGYDGGAVFSPDGSLLVYRAHHPADPQALAEYRELLAQNLVRPSLLEIWVMNADGSNQRQVTTLGAASFAPCFTPDGARILFSTNVGDPQHRNFDLYLVALDGTGLEQVTFNPTFDGFPLFATDGRRLAFCSNRGDARDGETNVFVADWVQAP